MTAAGYDVRLCYPFIEAVSEILTTQCNVNAQIGTVGFKEAAGEPADLAIIATLAGLESIATISICFPKRVILGVVNKMLGETYKEINADVEDASKELANLIFNQAKQRLAKKNIQATRSIPLIVLASNVKLRYLTRGKTTELPVNTDAGPVTIEITSQELTVSDKI